MRLSSLGTSLLKAPEPALVMNVSMTRDTLLPAGSLSTNGSLQGKVQLVGRVTFQPEGAFTVKMDFSSVGFPFTLANDLW